MWVQWSPTEVCKCRARTGEAEVTLGAESRPEQEKERLLSEEWRTQAIGW